MRKKYVTGYAVAASMILLMTGCGSEQLNMTPEQEALVGEYAAMALLRHDANNRSRLVSPEEVEAHIQKLIQKEEQQLEKEQEHEETSVGMDPTADTPVIEAGQNQDDNAIRTMEGFFELPEGVTILYTGANVCDSYPESGEENEYFALDASEGNKLIVLNFDILNSLQEVQTVDFLSQSPVIKITVNDKVTRFALTTMLMEDMSTYKGEIPAGGKISLVLLAEVPTDEIATVSSVRISLKNADQSFQLQLQ